MNVTSARATANEGFSDVLVWLNFILQNDRPPGEPVPLELKMMRGLFFVQLYGTVERVILDTMTIFLREVKALAPAAKDIDQKFYVVSMSNKWKSIKDQGYKKVFSQMRDFFNSQNSEVGCEINETLFDLYLQNISGAALDEIFLAIGIDFQLAIADRVLLNELVDNRNKVAHGRESATIVGGRYLASELQTKLQQAQNFTYQFISTIETFFDNLEFLQPASRQRYRSA